MSASAIEPLARTAVTTSPVATVRWLAAAIGSAEEYVLETGSPWAGVTLPGWPSAGARPR